MGCFQQNELTILSKIKDWKHTCKDEFPLLDEEVCIKLDNKYYNCDFVQCFDNFSPAFICAEYCIVENGLESDVQWCYLHKELLKGVEK